MNSTETVSFLPDSCAMHRQGEVEELLREESQPFAILNRGLIIDIMPPVEDDEGSSSSTPRRCLMVNHSTGLTAAGLCSFEAYDSLCGTVLFQWGILMARAGCKKIFPLRSALRFDVGQVNCFCPPVLVFWLRSPLTGRASARTEGEKKEPHRRGVLRRKEIHTLRGLESHIKWTRGSL